MNRSLLAGNFRESRFWLAALASSLILAGGCSTMQTPTASAVSSGVTGKIGGQVHGGNQPVANAQVSLYFAGQGPVFGSAATLAAVTTTADNGAGTFSFNLGAPGTGNTGTDNNFSCPSTGEDRDVYLISRAGNTLNTHTSDNNIAAAFIAPMGRCNTINGSTFISMSEVVTVATLASIQQFYSPVNANIGSDGTLMGTTSVKNAFANVFNIVDLSTGLARTATQTGTANGTAGTTVTITPETAKINHIANIISACVNNPNSSASSCTTLFANAVPPAAAYTSKPADSYPAATDVLQAAYYMLTNPTNGGSTTRLNALYALSPAAGAPYQPTLTAAPNDWTIGLQYRGNGNCSVGGALISSGYGLSVDPSGNIWIANAGSGTIAEISPVGTPLLCVATGALLTSATLDTTMVAGQPVSNFWAGSNNSNHIYRYRPSDGSLLDNPTPAPVNAVTSDGYGDIFFSTNAGNLYVLAHAATTSSAITPVQINSVPLGTAFSLMVDANNVIWASSGSSNITATSTALLPTDPTYPSGFSSTSFTVGSPANGLALTQNDGSNNNGVYVASGSSANSLSYLRGAGASYVSQSGFPTAANVGGLNAPFFIALDGRQNIWAVNDGTLSTTEIGSDGTALSPSGGFVHPTGFTARSLVIDQSGNVWEGFSGSVSLAKILGSAVPVFQPFATGLPPNLPVRFQQIP